MTAPFSRISIEQVARYPRPGMGGPARWSFTPDGGGIAYLATEDGGLVRSLWLYDIASGGRRGAGGGGGGGGGGLGGRWRGRRAGVGRSRGKRSFGASGRDCGTWA